MRNVSFHRKRCLDIQIQFFFLLLDAMDISKLEESLKADMASDNLYWVRNDAKLRAAKQTASYEEFDQIVKASHLKPLSREDHLQKMDPQGNSKTCMNTACRQNGGEVKICRISPIKK